MSRRTPALPYRSAAELESRIDEVRSAPADVGTVHLVVRRPSPGVREILTEGVLDPALGLVGDGWLSRSTPRAIAAGRHLDAQVNVMSAPMVRLLADTAQEQAYAGDQLFLDLDISVANLPVGSHLELGEPGGAVIEVCAKPHNGCAKFVARYGEEATRWVNNETGRSLRLRGFNARVVAPGLVRPGDTVRVIRRGGLDDRAESATDAAEARAAV